MEKLTRKQEKVVCKLIHCAYNKEITQFILKTIGKENWSRAILSNCMHRFMTEEQQEISDQLGGGYSFDEMWEKGITAVCNKQIVEKLKEKGITRFLYENDDYIDAIRMGEEVVEGIDVKAIRRKVILAVDNSLKQIYPD